MLLNLLKALMTIVPTQDIRYYLCGIHLSYDGENTATLTATDGHRLAQVACNVRAMRDDTVPAMTFIRREPFEAIIPQEQIKTLLAGANRKTMLRFVVDIDGVLKGHKDQLDIPLTPIEGRFPDVKRVIPNTNRKTDVSSGIGLNGAYVGDASKFAKLLEPSNKQGVIQLKFGSPTDSVLVNIEIHNECITDIKYVIMPARYPSARPESRKAA